MSNEYEDLLERYTDGLKEIDLGLLNGDTTVIDIIGDDAALAWNGETRVLVVDLPGAGYTKFSVDTRGKGTQDWDETTQEIEDDCDRLKEFSSADRFQNEINGALTDIGRDDLVLF